MHRLPPERRTLLLAALALLAAACREPEEPGPPPEPGAAAWAPRQAELARHTPGFLVWESNRSGAWRLWTRNLDGSGLRQLSPDEAGRSHWAPHVSPDGRHVAYLSMDDATNAYARGSARAERALRLHRLADGADRVLAPGARAYREDRAAVWIDARRLVYLAADGSTHRLDVESGADERLYADPSRDFGFLLDPTLRHATSGDPSFAPFDPVRGVLAFRHRLPGCQPYFTRDGHWGFWVARPGGPIRRIDLGTEETSDVVARRDPRLPAPFDYVYFPNVSPGQRLLAFGASRGEHDHFRADYEIFVAPLDGSSLELRGPPVRYTFHPATDRFPDVFEAGGALGRHRGEAPLRVALRPPEPGHAGVAPGAGADDGRDAHPWSWDFGDGARAEGAIGEHVYREPGVHTVTARRGEAVWHGEVQVDPPTPPRVRWARVGPGPRELRVSFDERIALAEDAALRLERAGPVEAARIADDGRTLVVRAARPLQGADRLWLEGVTDRAEEPHARPASWLPVEAHPWPVDREHLLLVFETARHANLVRDVDSGLERGHEALARGRARLDHHHRLDTAGGSFRIPAQGELVDRIHGEDAFALEATVTPDAVPGGAGRPGVLVALGRGPERLNAALTQEDGMLVLRLRTSATPRAGRRIELAPLRAGEVQHVLVSAAPPRLEAWLEGRRVARRDDLEGDFSTWRGGVPLQVGGFEDGAWPWAGVVEGIAVHARFLEADDARRSHAGYREHREDRDPVDPVRVRARRRAHSTAPAPDQIAPYREALVVHEYAVEEVLSGELGEDVIRVAHYAILGGRAQARTRDPRDGEVVELVLEPFDANPQVASLYRADDLRPDPDAPLFLDVDP